MIDNGGFDPTTGSWNESLSGDFLWSRNNFGEARPDVMSPFTYSVSEKVWDDISLLPGYHLAGNICGRYYANISINLSILISMGKSKDAALRMMQGTLGNVPKDLNIPIIPLPRGAILRTLPRWIKMGLNERNGAKNIPNFLATNPGRCQTQHQQILQTQSKKELIAFWHNNIMSEMTKNMWVLGGSVRPLEATMKFKKELSKLIGEADTNTLFSNLSSENDMLASLGPVVGVDRVARGLMSRTKYIEKYGHRGPHEAEFSIARPAEDPEWLEKQLSEYEKNPVDVDAMLAQRRSEFAAARTRLLAHYPKKAQYLRREIEKVGPAARIREAVRDEITRSLWVNRAWALRAGELTGLGENIFLLTIDEILDLLSGINNSTIYIPIRREIYNNYRDLPPYPMIIRGAFDPFQWAADPKRRYDIYDATAMEPISTSNILSGFPGATGIVEGQVRVLGGPEQGDQFQSGEILVAVTTNIGWTLLFPRAAAIVTDVGAPLSHAAIVARELGIPAVVGCGSATTSLRSGDWVRVDGGRGTVEILGNAS